MNCTLAAHGGGLIFPQGISSGMLGPRRDWTLAFVRSLRASAGMSRLGTSIPPSVRNVAEMHIGAHCTREFLDRIPRQYNQGHYDFLWPAPNQKT